MSETDEQLALQAQRGDAAAFHLLLERHYDTVYRVAYRFLGGAADAEDVAQEVCSRLAEKIGRFRGASRFSTWLYAVTLNAVRDHGRRQRAAAGLHGAYANLAEHQSADWADSDRKVRWLYLALDRLEGPLKETALLILAEEMSHAEVGEVLGVKESTVSWRMHEVKKRLKVMATHD
ncbi:MAG: sigma-70 family RNA polymerase sigma factor [Rhizobiales bacterium]|nr:sigma-70 family RNA polymerase sigma factor [Hyphomicrobiales bacterium]